MTEQIVSIPFDCINFPNLLVDFVAELLVSIYLEEEDLHTQSVHSIYGATDFNLFEEYIEILKSKGYEVTVNVVKIIKID